MDGPEYGWKSDSPPEKMDRIQVLPPSEPKAVDAVYFVGASSKGQYFVAATARRPNDHIDGFCYVRIPEVGLLKSPKLPDTSLKASASGTYTTTDGLRIEPVEPMKRWRLTYDGVMKLDGSDSDPVVVHFDLTWKSDLPFFDFNTDIPPAAMARTLAREPWSRQYFQDLQKFHQEHYEQMGQITGTVQVEGHGTYDVALDGMRDHSFSKHRDWKRLHRYGLHSVTVEDGTRFCVGIISQPGFLSVFEMGYLYTPDGRLHGVDWCNLELFRHGEKGRPPVDYSFTFRAGGKQYLVQCQVLFSPELFIGEEWEARIVERMCRYRVNGREAWGFAEWEYRHHGGRPDTKK